MSPGLERRRTAAPPGPLESPAFSSHIPGAPTAFDGPAVQPLLQAALLAGSGSTLEECRVSRAVYLPREKRCNLVYELRLRDDGGASMRRTLVARLFSSRSRCEEYFRTRLAPLAPLVEGREEMGPFAHPVAQIEPLHLSVSVFPIDGDLPELLTATDPDRMRRLLQEELPEPWSGRSLEAPRVEIVQYHRRRRCVLRYGLAASGSREERREPQTLYAKLYAQPCSQSGADAMTSLRALAGGERGVHAFHVPRPLAHLLGSHLLLLEAIPGRGRISHWVRQCLRDGDEGNPRLEAALDVVARIAATLHTSAISLGRRHAFEDELRELHDDISGVEPVAPDLGRRLRSSHERLEARAKSCEALPLRFSHGDFSQSQLLLDGAVGGLVDFDDVCQAEPARDLGSLLSHLRLTARKADFGAADAFVESLRDRLLTTYVTACKGSLEPERLLPRVALYEASSLLHLSVASWLKFKRERLEHALASLASLEARADGRA
jgi:Ser/Thr protein kinase RdoA (MazF antagonist)